MHLAEIGMLVAIVGTDEMVLLVHPAHGAAEHARSLPRIPHPRAEVPAVLQSLELLDEEFPSTRSMIAWR